MPASLNVREVERRLPRHAGATPRLEPWERMLLDRALKQNAPTIKSPATGTTYVYVGKLTGRAVPLAVSARMAAAVAVHEPHKPWRLVCFTTTAGVYQFWRDLEETAHLTRALT